METAQEYITGVLISFVRKMFLDRNYSIVFTFNEKTKMYSNRIEMQLFYTRDDDEEAELFMILSYDKTHGIIKKFSMEKNFDKLFIEKHGEGNYNYLLKNIQYSHLPLKLDFQSQDMDALLKDIGSMRSPDNSQEYEGEIYYYT